MSLSRIVRVVAGERGEAGEKKTMGRGMKKEAYGQLTERRFTKVCVAAFMQVH